MADSKATGKARHPYDASRPVPAAVRRAVDKSDIKALKIALTPRQRAFAHEYVVDFNGTAAAVRAGYSSEFPDRQAHILLKHEGVSAYIDHLTKSKASKIMSVTPEYLLQRLTEIMNKEEARDGDKLRAIEMYMKHLGLFIDKQEITGKDGGAIEVNERRIQQDVESFVSTIKRMGSREVKPDAIN